MIKSLITKASTPHLFAIKSLYQPVQSFIPTPSCFAFCFEPPHSCISALLVPRPPCRHSQRLPTNRTGPLVVVPAARVQARWVHAPFPATATVYDRWRSLPRSHTTINQSVVLLHLSKLIQRQTRRVQVHGSVAKRVSSSFGSGRVERRPRWNLQLARVASSSSCWSPTLSFVYLRYERQVLIAV